MIINDIRIHLHTDETTQQAIEAESAEQLLRTYRRSLRSLKVNTPNIAHMVENAKSSNISVFCNKNREFNIVDFGTGQAFYGLAPHQEVKNHLDSWAKNANKSYELSHHTLLEDAHFLQAHPINTGDRIDTLVCLGLGGGMHLEHLLNNYSIRHLIVYEPEIQYFKASAMMCDWQQIFAIAKEKNTILFFMPQNTGETLIDDLKELQSHTGIDSFYLYKHYNHPIFDGIYASLDANSWGSLSSNNLNIEKYLNTERFKPAWTQRFYSEKTQQLLAREDDLLTQNLAAFEKYFPDIYQEFKNYNPSYWLPIRDEDGDINLMDNTDKSLVFGYA